MANPQTDEFESDPEDAPLHSLRRLEASDDESTDGELPARRDPRGQTSYDDDSNKQSGVRRSDDDKELVLEDEEVAKGSDDDNELVLEDEEAVKVVIEEMEKDRGEKQYVSVSGSLIGQNLGREVTSLRDTDQAAEQYDFPTESFYSEDSRYQGKERRGRQRSMPVGRKLWQVNDNHRFGKMNLSDGRISEDGQVTSGQFQGFGRGTGRGYFGDNSSKAYHNERNNGRQNYNRSNYAWNNDRTSYHANSNERGTGRGYVRGIRTQANRDKNNYNRSNYDQARYDRRSYYKSNGPSDYGKSNGSENYDLGDYARNNNRRNYGRNNGRNNYDPRNYAPNNDRINYDRSNYNHRNFPRSVRGKGSMRYVPAQNKSNELAAYEQKQSSMPEKPNLEISVGRQPEVWNLQPEPVLPRKNVFFANLNPAAQPYYPTGSSLIDPSFPSTQCGTFTDRIINSDNMIARNSIINPLLQSLESSLLPQSTIRSSYFGIPDTNTNTLSNNSWAVSLNQVANVPLQIHPPVQPPLTFSSQQPGQQLGSENQALDLYGDPTSIFFEHEESRTNSLISSSKSKTLMAEKEKIGNPDSENATILHNGAKIIGVACAMDLQHGDQGSLGFPIVHRALPEYVSQSHHAFGNSWLPMLGATVDFGASGCYPNVALDSSSSLEQASSVSSIETSLTKTSSTCQPLQAQETVIDEIPQPRRRLRYSEMDFSKQ